jgi:cytochrome P450
MAGADSAAIGLRAVFYYTMKHPAVMKMLVAEIDMNYENGNLRSPVGYNDVVKLPYTTAVIKEAMRLFPSFQVGMQRYAPLEGIVLAGKHIPAGCRVGMNPGCVQYSREVFGQDSNVFRPERWLEDEEQAKAMERTMINFGVGTRTCTGKHVSLLAFLVFPSLFMAALLR